MSLKKARRLEKDRYAAFNSIWPRKAPAMAIFLGKQYLGQKDDAYTAPQYAKIVVERTVSNDAGIKQSPA